MCGSRHEGFSPRSLARREEVSGKFDIPKRILCELLTPLTRDAAGLPLAGTELAPVDDAGILVAGGAQRDGAGHRAILERALEAIRQVARLVAAAEAERDPIGVER